jgi:hypothetical protein
MDSHKKCSSCRLLKPLDDFHIAAESPDGRSSFCRACQNRSAPRYRFTTFKETTPKKKTPEQRRADTELKYRDGRICPSCSLVKPLDEFGIRQNGKVKSLCKPCNNKYITNLDRRRAARDSGDPLAYAESQIRRNPQLSETWEIIVWEFKEAQARNG